MKKVLITGASGFIGTALTKRLQALGYELYLLSRNPDKLSSVGGASVKRYQVDLEDASFLKKIEHNVKSLDAVIHLAASTNYFGNYRSLRRCNVLSTLNVFASAREMGANKFVFTSSIEAMGTRGGLSPATELDTTRPVSSYGASKLEAEKALAEANDGAMELVVPRIGNVYGPGGSFLIPSFAASLLRHDENYRFVCCYKDQLFQLIYIDDVVDGVIRALEYEHVAGTYILAGDEPVTVEGIMRMICEILGLEFRLKPEGSWQRDYLRFRTQIRRIINRADLLAFLIAGAELGPRRTFRIDKAKNGFGFSPRTPLKQGIAMTLEGIREAMLREKL